MFFFPPPSYDQLWFFSSSPPKTNKIRIVLFSRILHDLIWFHFIRLLASSRMLFFRTEIDVHDGNQGAMDFVYGNLCVADADKIANTWRISTNGAEGRDDNLMQNNGANGLLGCLFYLASGSVLKVNEFSSKVAVCLFVNFKMRKFRLFGKNSKLIVYKFKCAHHTLFPFW